MSLHVNLWYQKFWDEFSLIFYPKQFGQKEVAEPGSIANSLLPIIVRHSDYAVIDALAKYTVRAAKTYPRDIDAITRSLSIVQSQPGVSTLAIYKPRKWIGRSKMSYDSAMSTCLGEVIDDSLDDTDSDSEKEKCDFGLHPDDIRLTTALFSASAIKYGLQPPEKAVAAIRQGLRNPNQVFAVVACLHLAICGDRMETLLEESLPDGGIQLALAELRVSSAIDTPTGMELLKRTTAIVDSKFSAMVMLTEEEAWDILFPKKD